MKPFMKLTAVGAPLPLANVDTDKIIPARFMKTIKRDGLGKNLFDALRYENGKERPDFVLNQDQFRNAEILISHENFGCGSSREHAPWALLDFGIRCIVAPGFADIFYNNCLKNGILPVCLPKQICDELMADARLGGNARFTVDLEDQVVIKPDGSAIRFEIDESQRERLLNGVDDIDQTFMSGAEAIDEFENTRAHSSAWQPDGIPQFQS